MPHNRPLKEKLLSECSVTTLHKPIKIEMKSVGDLKPRDRNPRTHTKKQIQLLVRIIKETGFLVPVLAEKDGAIIAGHARWEAAKLLGLEKIPVIHVTGLSPAKIRSLVIADNRIAELAGWDKDLLAIEMREIADLDLDFDLSITGFEGGELGLLLDETAVTPDTTYENFKTEVRMDAEAITCVGDTWMLRRHRVRCGDARLECDYEALLGKNRAQMVFTDPPFNVKIDGHVSGKGKVKHREFVAGVGEFNKSQFTQFLTDACQQMAAFSVDGSIHYICMDWRHCEEILAAGAAAYDHGLKNICVFVKSNAGMGTFYRSRHEFVFVFKNGTAKHINNFELGQHGRWRSNVWEYQGANVVGPGRLETLKLHSTCKPVLLVRDAIFDCSRRNGIILDPFLGSGTSLIASEITGRRCYGLELDPLYVDVVVRRWEQFTRDVAVHADTGRTFAQTAADRGIAMEADHVA